jgi:hypothetical protein
LGLALGAECLLLWWCERYGKGGGEFELNTPASIGAFWHFPGLGVLYALGLCRSGGTAAAFAVGAIQFFVMFLLAAWLLKVAKDET